MKVAISSIAIALIVISLSFHKGYAWYVQQHFADEGSFFSTSQANQLNYLAWFHEQVAKQDTIIILPGLGGHAFLYRKFGKELAQRYNVVIVDRLSYGLSKSKDNEPILETFSQDLRELLNHLNIGRPVHVLGLSLGSAYGTDFYRRNPDLVASLVNSDCPVPEEEFMGEEYIDSIYGGWMKKLEAIRLLSRFSIPQLKTTFSYLAGTFAEAYLPDKQMKHIETTLAEGKAFWQIIRDARFYDSYHDLPLLVLSSAEDMSLEEAKNSPVIAYQSKLSRSSSQGRHIIFPNTSHSQLIGNEGGRLLEEYQSFLDEIAP